MLILGVQMGAHDSAAAVFDDYQLLAAVSLERLSRLKNDGRSPLPSIDEVLRIAGATRRDVDVIALGRLGMPTQFFTHFSGFRWLREKYRLHVQGIKNRVMWLELARSGARHADEIFDTRAFLDAWDFGSRTRGFYYNHHEAHALPAIFYTGWDEALIVTADGGGDATNYSHRYFNGREIETLYGGEERLYGPPAIDSLGRAYSDMTAALGFRALRHEGKVTGLAALGSPTLAPEICSKFWVDESGQVQSVFLRYSHMRRFIRDIASRASREDAAASIQLALEDLLLASVKRLLDMRPSRHLGLAGGVFANVRLNRVLAENTGVDEVFIVPFMADDGLAVGGPLCFLLQRDGMDVWLRHRRPLETLYLGRDFGADADAVFAAASGVRATGESPVAGSAHRLAAGEIGAIYSGRMEFGPRALGARSILGNPSNRATHDELNHRLSRTEFMPFAPVVTAPRAADVFDLSPLQSNAARFMTITCAVRDAWRSRIPAVVHADGTARPQVIDRETNALYYDIVSEFERVTGLPVLVNTSFNVHEEPIVNRPEECLQALQDGRIDFLVTPGNVYVRDEF